MKAFMDKDFLLQTDAAKELYHEHAAKMPIIDYHCHLIPKMVAENKRFDSIAQIWLMGDHYKWRAMRSNGVPERYCTGSDTTDWEKFEKWAETVPYTFRNPLYHWTHLELKTAFGIEKRLNPETAKEIFKLGMYIGFTGVLTFKNAKKALKALAEVPMDKLLMETDCPYMAPEPFRGKRCDSSMIAYTAAKAAEIKGITTQELIDITCQNGMTMYGIQI